ncbi:HAD family hydrolase [Pseudoalteromonas lipolytica]
MLNSTEKNIQQERFSNFGTTFLGPTLSFFMQGIDKATTEQDTLYFLAREGYWLEKAYIKSNLNKELKHRTCYLLASRAFLFKILLDNEKSYSYSLKSAFSGTFLELMSTRFILSNSEIRSVFSDETCSMMIQLPSDKKEVERILSTHRNSIQRVISETKSAYLSYLDSQGVIGQEVLHLVDLGYSGTIQSLLSLLLGVDTYGHYLIASQPGERYINNAKVMMVGYLKEGVKLQDGYLPLDRSMFLESLLSAPFGQFRDIRLNPLTNEFDFYYGRQVNAQRFFQEIEQVMLGALAYCEFANEKSISFTKEEIEMLLESYLSKPNMIPRCIHHVFDIDDDVAGNGTVNALHFFGLAS